MITGVGSLSLLQGIFPTQGLNPGLPHCRRILYQLSYQGSPSPDKQRVRAFIERERGLHAEIAWSSLTVIFRLVIGDLTSTILVILLYCSCVLSCIQLFVTLWTVVGQAPLSMGFSRQEYWSRLPCPFPGDLPNPGIKPHVSWISCMAGRFFTH